LWRSVDETGAVLNDLRLVLVILAPIFLVASLAGGWFLSRRALRPVDEITDMARQISLQNLSGSLPVPAHRDELQRLCQAWNEMLSRLDKSARQLRQFTADASHELRTPVALIRTTAELALRQQRSIDDYQTALSRIEQEARDLTQLLESLMELARADSGQTRFSLVPVDIGDLVSEVRTQAVSINSDSRLDVAIDVPSAPLAVLGDRGALRRLLLVLLDNAMKFTSAPGRVSLRVTETSGEVVLEVEDSGIGISKNDLPRIFDRFYQAEASRSGSGVGLGLSIAQWIVQGHNGRIEVQSSPGEGSVFRVFLPALS
jgi:signal transduction histidine kinase